MIVITPPQLHVIGSGSPRFTATSATNVKRSGFERFANVVSSRAGNPSSCKAHFSERKRLGSPYPGRSRTVVARAK